MAPPAWSTARTGTVVGLGEAEAADNLSLGESGQVLFLELVASERVCCGRFLPSVPTENSFSGKRKRWTQLMGCMTSELWTLMADL